jgi:hypothetical protein
MTEFKVLSFAELMATKPAAEDAARLALAKRLTIKARDLNLRFGPQATNHVARQGGNRLSKIYWQGRQWAATKYGVECRDGSYAIERTRLWEEEDQYGWILHMAEKDWVELEDFAEALRVARMFNALKFPWRRR